MIQSILTHPGSAHKDELLACAVLLSKYKVPIFRREPTQAELEDASIAVVDIGSEHSPERNNFDHHQFPREHPPVCALSLVLQHLGLYDDALTFCSWLETTEWLDCRGPGNTAKWLGIDRETLGKLNSPLDSILLRRFAEHTVHRSGEPIWELIYMLGSDLVDYITSQRARLNFVAEHAEQWTLYHNELPFSALYMPRITALPEELSAAMANYAETLAPENTALALVYPDSRGQGYALRRLNDNLQLDFCKLQQEPDVHFVHNQGFIAKTSSTDVRRLKELMCRAYV